LEIIRTVLTVTAPGCSPAYFNVHGRTGRYAIERWSTQMTIAMDNQPMTRTHKGKGIASFTMGVTSVVAFVALIGSATVLTQTGKLTPDANIIIGFGVISACFVDLIGIILGFIGAFDRSSKKTYPVWGLSLNIGILVLFAALVFIGLSMKHH
jgi:hypothetical protein